MNTYTKATTDISHISIVVHTAQQSETIDDQDISLRSFFRSCLRIAHHLLALYQRKNQLQMLFCDDMRSNQQAPILVLIKERYKDILIWWPRATGNKYLEIMMRYISRLR